MRPGDLGLRAAITRGDEPGLGLSAAVTQYEEPDLGLPAEVPPPPSPRKYWTRKGIAYWLVERLSEDLPTLVGVDHGFSFPLRYFEVHGLEPDWPAFLDDFQRHWPTDEDHTYVDFVRDGSAGNGAARTGNARWRRLTEERAGGAKSVFHFDVQISIGRINGEATRGPNNVASNCVKCMSCCPCIQQTILYAML